MTKKPTKVRVKKPQETEQEKPVQPINRTAIRIATIWSNKTKSGKPFYSLVLETGERLVSFDSNVVLLAGGDLKKNVNNFNPPAVVEGYIVDSGGFKNFRLPKDVQKAASQTEQAATPKRTQEESDAISRMSILRTAAMLLEFEKVKSMKRFAELIKICEKYVFEGKIEVA